MGVLLPASASYGSVLCFVASAIIVAKLLALSQRPDLDAFPAVGSNSWLGSLRAGLKFLTNAQKFIQEGYDKHNPSPFKVADPFSWTVFLSDRKHLEELSRASDSDFSLTEATQDRIQSGYTVGQEMLDNPYSSGVIRTQLTRNIEALYPEIREEIVTSFDEVLNLEGNEWKSVAALSAFQQVVCRTSNRVFVGLPLCRDPDWIDLNIQYTLDIVKGGLIVGFFPEFMKPWAVWLLTNIPRCINRGMKHLGPIIDDRKTYLNEYGTKWDDKLNDLLSWLMDVAEGPELTTVRLTTRMLIANFTAIHTTSNSFTQAFFYLAANPHYVQPLREEVESIVEKDGWTKIAISKMRRVDSFLKECERISGTNITPLFRKALRNFTFSDGTFIPQGALVAAPAGSVHHNANFYANPEAFEPFRFADMQEEDGDDNQKHQFVSTSTEFLVFGLGRHACPGRFFAAAEMKSMLAHIVVAYDVKLEDNTTRPPTSRISIHLAVDARAKVMFRNRKR